ncbi:hypothetical protein FAI40_08145 [Acetobacteraceae bacterium]|nr:hypothetical protein FAI40_08145 [Acetobacteraceae bacterium]
MNNFLEGNNYHNHGSDEDPTIVISEDYPSPLSARAAKFSNDSNQQIFVFDDLNIKNKSDITKAAAPLLSFMAGLVKVQKEPDFHALRSSLVSELYKYVEKLQNIGVDNMTIQTAHYILCASLDDIVHCMPWFLQAKQAQLPSLSAEFHHDVQSGSRFFLLLKKLSTSPSSSLPLLELMYYCMSLGMRGYYRFSPNGAAEFSHSREELYLLITRYQNKDRNTLSPHCQGIFNPYKPLKFEFPIWMAGIAAAIFIIFSYIACSLILGNNTDMLMGEVSSIPPVSMPIRDRISAVSLADDSSLRHKLSKGLSKEIQTEELTIKGSEMVPVIRLNMREMFGTAATGISPKYKILLEKIGKEISLNNVSRVKVVGYTDSKRIHTLLYPSNYDLSLARAQSIATILSSQLKNTKIVSIGHGEQNHIGDNKTEEGRQLNRRVEIVVEGDIK